MLDFNKIFTKKNYPKIIALVVLLIGFVAIALYYQDYLKPNVSISEKSTLISIPDSTSFDNLVMMLKNKNILKDYESFITVSNKLGYKRDFVRGGRYKIENGWNNLRLVRHLRSGNQEPVNLVLHNERNIEEVASKISNFVNIDSTVMLNYIKDSTVLAKYHCNLDDVLTNFIPNTYQVFWNTKPDKLFKRLADEADKFWLKNGRLEKAKLLGLTKKEVYILASIVEKETIKKEEKAKIAGLYLNRLKTGMKLQADPTAVFASKDFLTKRVTTKHTLFDSPYNTYMYEGLPPGPICMPSITTIDSVLSPVKHDYLFMCAKPDYSGLHAFAVTLEAHYENARKYQDFLTKNGL